MKHDMKRVEKKKLNTLKDMPFYGDPMGLITKDRENLRSVAREWVEEIKKNFRKRFGEKALDELNELLEERDITYQSILRKKVAYVDSNFVDAHSKISWIRMFFNIEDE